MFRGPSWRKQFLRTITAIVALAGVACLVGNISINAQAKKLPRQFESKTVTNRTPGHSVNVEVDVTGAKRLFLVVSDGGNGYSHDWADWAEPRLVGPKGELKLTKLKWKSATSNWGQVSVNKNVKGGALRIAGKPVEYGIGTHANSVIVFDLPKGYTHFKARGGLDNGGTGQVGGRNASVRFHVFLDKMPPRVQQLARGSGVQQPQGGNLDPEKGLAALDTHKDLETKIFAAEPMMLNPTNIDIDHRGRVWVAEVVNYRGRRNTRPAGDRILILEDTNGDGKADTKKVFYQGRDIDSVHGICVLGTPDGKNSKVIVSVGSGVYIFHDKDGDDKADGKTTFFTGISGTQHDHGIHAFVFGPDGKLYFNFGNSGRQIRDAKGAPIVDMAGNVVAAHRKPYQEGMVFRCNMDGSDFETLGWNFRNNWEVCVDSFGTIWQSDNDDDGNLGVRINYVMEFGNYGYRDELTGAGWQANRTGIEKDKSHRHWHQNDPGVIPNLVHTGNGSPTGICVYEHELLPKVFRGQVIHTDARPGICRAYPAKQDGAGYSAKIVDILRGTRDKWYRPSDVCVGPDGSLFVADWYDPGVGGHRMGDVDKGRIFRVAPPKTAYKIPKFDFSTAAGAADALRNPALSVRCMAWTALHNMQQKAEPELLKMIAQNEEGHIRARAYWLLGKIKGKEKQYIDRAVADSSPDIRIVGLRLARQLKLDVLGYVTKLLRDPSPQVRRECCLALRYQKGDGIPSIWADLAAQHDGKDRWYLEALGIAADGRWDTCLDAYLKTVGVKWKSPAGYDIIWRSRAAETPGYIAQIVSNPMVTRDQLPRYFRAFHFLRGKRKEEALIQLAFAQSQGDEARKSFIASEAISRLKGFNINNPANKAALDRVLDRAKGTSQFVKLVSKFGVKARYPELVQLVLKHSQEQVGVDAVVVLLEKGQTGLIESQIQNKDAKIATAAVQALGASQDARMAKLLMPLVGNKNKDIGLRREAVRALGGIRPGAQRLVKLALANKLDPQLKESAGAALHKLNWRQIQAQVSKLFPLPAAKDNKPLPSIETLVGMRGNVERGVKIFRTTGTCAKCHVVSKFGKEVGPDLSEIGDKLSKSALYESILFPSAAINHNYESFLVVLKDGNVSTGLLISQTPAEIKIKGEDAIIRTFKKAQFDSVLKQPVSLMPRDIAKLMTAQELADVVAYMETLRKKKVERK